MTRFSKLQVELKIQDGQQQNRHRSGPAFVESEA